MSSLKEKTEKGLFWGAINSGSTQILNIAFGIFLARILSPADYGVVGMLTIFTALAGNLQDSGFSTALVNIKNIKARDYNAVFWFSIMMSCALYTLLFFCAPLIAWFFNQPCLTSLSRLLFLSFVLSSIGIAHGAYMIRNLMNKEKAIIGMVALISSGSVGIILALNGKGYWSLAWQQIAFIFVLNLGRFYYVDWRPSVRIDFAPIREMFGFSYKILITTIVSTVSQNILTVIFGRLFAAKTVGNFTQAHKWNTMSFAFVANTLAQVAQPVFAKINDEQDRQLRVLRKMIRFTAFLAFPTMFGLSLISQEFILLAISDKWIDSVPILRILAIGGAFMPLYTVYQNLMLSKSRSDIYMWCSVLQIALQLALIIALHKFGILYMVGAYTAFNIAWLIVWQYFAKRLVKIGFLDALKDILPFMLISAMVMLATHFLTIWIADIALRLCLKIIIAAVMYFIIMKSAHAKIMDECISYLRAKAHK